MLRPRRDSLGRARRAIEEDGGRMVLEVLALAAQQATLTGVVRDSAGVEPVAFAEVRVSSAEMGVAAGFSDRFGAFAIPNAPAGPARVEAGAFGYAPWSRDYDRLPSEPLRILPAPPHSSWS